MDKNRIAQKCAKLEIRVQNLYTKLFYGMQDHTVAPELRRCAVDLRKCAEAGNYAEACENARKVSYLLDVTHKNRLVIDQVYESVKADAEEVVATLAEAEAAGSETPGPETPGPETADTETPDAETPGPAGRE